MVNQLGSYLGVVDPDGLKYVQGPYKAEQESYLDCTGSRDHEITMNAKINRDPNNCSVRDICISFNVILKFDLNNDYEVKRGKNTITISGCLSILLLMEC